MNKKSINKRHLFIYIVIYGGFIIFLMATDPRTLSLPLLFVPFLWLFVCAYIGVKHLLRRFSNKYRHLPHPKQATLAFVIGVVPVCMLLLKSIDQLTVRDGLILLGLVTFGSFYASRAKLFSL